MTEVGTVVERLSGNRVRVEVHRGAACDGCHAKGACAPLSSGGIVRFDADDPFGFAPGDCVRLAIAEGGVLKAVWWVYGVPMILAIVAGVGTWYGLTNAGYVSGPRDLLAASASVGGVAVGFGILRLVELRVRRSAAPSFRVHVVGPADEVSPSPPTGE